MSEAEQVYQRKFSSAEDDAYASDTIVGSGGLLNKNTEWLQNPYTWVIYVLFNAFIWAALHLTQLFTLAESATLCNIIHGLLTFIFFHWIKGTPDEFTQGDWNGLTLWEQLDAGLPWTPTKKFLILMPAFLCFVPLVVSGCDTKFVAVNLPVFVILVVAKLPAMHRVRIMSINSTAGIDDLKRQ